MSYQDFLNTLVLPIRYFIEWLTQIANNLINNYIFITLLGITLFISLVWLIFYLIFDYLDKINNYYDDYNDKYFNYEMLKKVQSDYLNNHYADEFDYRYRSKILNGQVLNAYLSNNNELDIDNKRLANLNKIDSLKEIKTEKLTDNNPSNDNDLYYIVPPKPQLADWNELKQAELKEMREELKNNINSEIERIENENKDLIEKMDYVFIDHSKIKRSVFESNSFNTDNYFNDSNGFLIDKNTGEVVGENFPLIPTGSIDYANIPEEERRKIELHNDEQARKLGIKRYYDTSYIDEDLDSQLFL